MIRLENWSVKSYPDNEYTLPEMRVPVLSGIPDKHPHKPDKDVTNKYVLTTEIVASDGRKITTRSGTVYLLGSIDPEYKKWVKKDRPNWDWRNPITIRKDK